MTVYHLYADDAGDSHVQPVALREVDVTGEGAGRVRLLDALPAYDVGLAETIDPLDDQGLHPAPRRALLVILAGNYEIEGTSGDKVLLQPGDCMLADDATAGKGHWSRDVGEERLTIMSIGIPDDYVFPPA